jgi:hypothetical protein
LREISTEDLYAAVIGQRIAEGLSRVIGFVWCPYKDSTGDTLPHFTGDRRAVLLRIGSKLWHCNVAYDKDGTDEDDWYDVMVVSHYLYLVFLL